MKICPIATTAIRAGSIIALLLSQCRTFSTIFYIVVLYCTCLAVYLVSKGAGMMMKRPFEIRNRERGQ